MSPDFTAELLASAIKANCAQYTDGRISRRSWDREQSRLWRQAIDKQVSQRVAELVSPSLVGVR